MRDRVGGDARDDELVDERLEQHVGVAVVTDAQRLDEWRLGPVGVGLEHLQERCTNRLRSSWSPGCPCDEAEQTQRLAIGWICSESTSAPAQGPGRDRLPLRRAEGRCLAGVEEQEGATEVKDRNALT